jgi:hypothetical protein
MIAAFGVNVEAQQVNKLEELSQKYAQNEQRWREEVSQFTNNTNLKREIITDDHVLILRRLENGIPIYFKKF